MSKFEEIQNRHKRLIELWEACHTVEDGVEFDDWWGPKEELDITLKSYEDIPLLLKALELAHKAWQEEYQSGCYEGGYSSLVDKNELLTPNHWLEEAMKE
jgi:hypothetical protein